MGDGFSSPVIVSTGRTSHWTRADTCGENSTGSSWACELHFNDIHGIYWARVRAVQDGEPSPWVSSSELLPYRDSKEPSSTFLLLLGGSYERWERHHSQRMTTPGERRHPPGALRHPPHALKGLVLPSLYFFPLPPAIVGPPTLSWQLQGHNLSINLSAPLTPYQSRHGSYKPLSRVLRKLRYHLRLYRENVLQQEVRGGAGGLGGWGGGIGVLWSPYPIVLG